MLLSLPIYLNNRIINRTFEVIQHNDTVVVKLYNIQATNCIELYKVILCSQYYGINLIPISFPLIFNIVNNYLVSDIYLIISTLTSHNDFFTILLNHINKLNSTNYVYFNNTNINTIINTIKLNTSVDDTEYINVENLINRAYYRINRYLNFCLSILISEDNFTISNNSKILQIINSIKKIPINFYGNEMSLESHMFHIKNPKYITKDKFFFFSNENKIIKLYISNILNDTIVILVNNNSTRQKSLEQYKPIHINKNKYNITSYSPKFMKSAKLYISIPNLINQLLYSKYNVLFELVASIIYKKNNFIIKLIKLFTSNINNSDHLVLLQNIKTEKLNIVNKIEPYFLDYIDIIPNNISFVKFKEIVCDINTFDHNILEKLFLNYTYPLNYDKRTLTQNFAKILYYSFKFYNNIIDINNIINASYINTKIKSIYIYLVKFYKMLKLNNIHNCFIYNSRTYTDTILYSIIKVLLYNDTFDLMIDINNNTKLVVSSIFIENIILIQLLTNITWKNISKQLPYFKYIIKNKNSLLIVDGKINRNIITTIDSRLKKIILDPLSMYLFLKKESDYYKWTINFKELIGTIFYNPIIFKNEDYRILSKILFYISKITIQSTDNNEYNKLIQLLQKYPHIILFNERINIKIKDIFKNNNINFGYLAKHINVDNITITDSNEISEDIVSNTINKLAKKYYKYKSKYLEIKTSEIIMSQNSLQK
jgi:hypothetical protein